MAEQGTLDDVVTDHAVQGPRPILKQSGRVTAWRTLLVLPCLVVAGVSLLTRDANAAACAAGFIAGQVALNSDAGNDKPGLCRRIVPGDLPAPAASTSNPPTAAPRPTGAWPKVPPHFNVKRFYQGNARPRILRTAPNGDLFVAESYVGQIRIIRPNGRCTAGTNSVFAAGLDKPFGIAFYPPGPAPKWVYVAENSRVVRYPYTKGQLGAGQGPETVVANLPQGAGQLPGQGHWTRDVVFSHDGKTMYVAVGSYSNDRNAQEDETDRADILAFNPDGTNRRIYATGIRNPVSLSVSPVDGALWASTNERDELGDNLVPDYVTEVRQGQFYGWPWYYIGNHLDPRHTADFPASHPAISIPSLLLQAHSATLGSAFYTGTLFPAEYQGSLFLALHGSWNRAHSTGGKVVRMFFDEKGHNKLYYEDFMTGFNLPDHKVWGRPVGLAVGHNGTLYVSDDTSSTIWCVNYTK